MQQDAIKYKKIWIPSGREYAFPDATRTRYGGSTYATQIKNYPVQGFATGDIVPCAFIEVWRAFKREGLRSLLILTVHDSIVVDCYPGEEDQVCEILFREMSEVGRALYHRYGVVLDVPIETEIKQGINWLDTNKVGVREYLFEETLEKV